MGSFSPIHWLIVALVILLVFGPKALNGIGRSVGRSVRTVQNVKKGMLGDVQSVKQGILSDVSKPPTSSPPPAEPQEKSPPSQPT
jgi:sec-independent protein translocase protein TatA